MCRMYKTKKGFPNRREARRGAFYMRPGCFWLRERPRADMESAPTVTRRHFWQYRIILSADTASEVRQPPERCLSRKARIVRCCLSFLRILGILFGGFGAACASYSRGLSVSLGSAGSFYFASGWFGRGNILDFWWVGMMAWDGFLCRVVGRNFPLRIIISHTSTP